MRWLPWSARRRGFDGFLRPGLGRAGRLLARIGGSWCQLLPRSHCPHQFDKTAHRNVRLTRRHILTSSSRLELAWANEGWLVRCPQVKRRVPTLVLAA
jgi:hypothetical protein